MDIRGKDTLRNPARPDRMGRMISVDQTIAVFGGSFDPPHVAHVMAVSWVLACTRVEKVIVVPVFSHAFEKPLVDHQIRIKMCRSAFVIFGDRVEVSAIEADLPVPSRTIATLTALSQANPGKGLRLVIGSDILEMTDDWYRFDMVCEMAPPIVLNRSAHRVVNAGPVLPEISSSFIREAVRKGEDVTAWVGLDVVRIIAEEGLYR